jgi:fatty-acid desaturase
MKKVKEWIKREAENVRARMDAVNGMYSGTPDSRTMRMGRAAIVFAVLLEMVEPIISFVVVMTLACVPTMAQTGGTIFGQDQSMVPNAVRQTVIFAAGIAFLVGALTVIWGAFQYSRRQECMNCFIGGGLLMTIGGVIALISYLASGRGVTVDRTLN